MELTFGSAARMTNMDPGLEQALVERCKRRDPEAFGRFVDAYQTRIYGYVKRMLRSSEDADDVAQEVFIKAFQAFDRFDGRSSLRTWLFRIAHNLCIDRLRKSDRSLSETSLDYDGDEGSWDIGDDRWQPENLVLNDELIQHIEVGLQTMSEKLRTVLLLHDREDLAYDEIAQALDLPLGTVKSRLFLARGHLQKHLTEYLGAQLR
ncbi:MAG: sigma-70 family RNA polymerase sigma factor [Fimbriimonadaceae bacterium]